MRETTNEHKRILRTQEPNASPPLHYHHPACRMFCNRLEISTELWCFDTGGLKIRQKRGAQLLGDTVTSGAWHCNKRGKPSFPIGCRAFCSSCIGFDDWSRQKRGRDLRETVSSGAGCCKGGGSFPPSGSLVNCSLKSGSDSWRERGRKQVERRAGGIAGVEMGGSKGNVTEECVGDGVFIYTLERGGVRALFTNWGATLMSLFVPDGQGTGCKQKCSIVGLCNM